MRWEVKGNFNEIVSLEGSHIVRTVEYSSNDPIMAIERISFSGYDNGTFQVYLTAWNEMALHILKAAMGPVSFMRSTLGSPRLHLITQDKKLIATFFNKLLAMQPNFAPHAKSLQQVIGFDFKDAYSDVFPTWFEQPSCDTDPSKITYYPGNAESVLREVFSRKGNELFYMTFWTRDEKSADALLGKLTADRQFPRETISHLTSRHITLETSDMRLLKFFLSRLVEFQPDVMIVVTKLSVEMNLHSLDEYSSAEIEQMYPAVSPPVPVDPQMNGSGTSPALWSAAIGVMTTYGVASSHWPNESHRLYQSPPVLFNAQHAPAAGTDQQNLKVKDTAPEGAAPF